MQVQKLDLVILMGPLQPGTICDSRKASPSGIKAMKSPRLAFGMSKTELRCPELGVSCPLRVSPVLLCFPDEGVEVAPLPHPGAYNFSFISAFGMTVMIRGCKKIR